MGGTPYQCPCCEKWFYAEGEILVDTTCTPMEDKVLDGFTKKYIEDTYSYMDECNSKGCEWDKPYGCVEYELYKQYAEPLFENMKAGNENDDKWCSVFDKCSCVCYIFIFDNVIDVIGAKNETL